MTLAILQSWCRVTLLTTALWTSFDAESVTASWGTWWMGKGDPRTRRGKIFNGTYGKSRPNPNKARKLKRFGEKVEAIGDVPIPEPPVEFETPREWPRVVEGVVWDVSDPPVNPSH